MKRARQGNASHKGRDYSGKACGFAAPRFCDKLTARLFTDSIRQNMLANISAVVAIVLYIAATSCHLLQGSAASAPRKPTLLLSIGALALALHGLAAAQMLLTPEGVNLSLWPMSSVIIFTVNLIVLLSSLKKPLHNLCILLFPASALVLLCSLVFGYSLADKAHLSIEIGIHVALSLLAYSLFTIAAGQSLLLAYQNKRLRNHHPGGFLHRLPPLQTMETLLFEMIWAGFILLTLSIITGFLFLDDIWAQHLAHKTFFSLVGWLVFAILLWGRARLGWRGTSAIRWTITGFVLLALAYWGSKFVIEVVLHNRPGL